MSQIETTVIPYAIATNRLRWKTLRSANSLTVARGSPWPEIALTLMGGSAICAFGVWLNLRVDDGIADLTNGFLFDWIASFAVIMVICVAFSLIGEQKAGPRLVLDRTAGVLTLPILDRTLPTQAIVGWQILEQEVGKSEHISQLNLIGVDENDEFVRHIVFTGLGRSMPVKIERLVEELASNTGISLVSRGVIAQTPVV